MSDRGVGVALVTVVLAAVLGLVLFIGAAGARSAGTGAVEPRLFFGDRPPPAARTIAQIQERLPGAVRPLVPVQRQIALVFSEAAGYLLVLLAVGTALVFARGAVLAAYRVTLGGWRAHLRSLALGGALLAVIGSALFLLFMATLGVVAGPPSPVAVGRGGFALGPASLLQVGTTAIGVAIVLIAIVATIGFAAAAWRLGDAALSLRPLARLGQATPPTLIALLGASLVYLVTQIPLIGQMALVLALAYALGTAAAARLAPAPAGP
ncbi:MAG: hypothetical protein WEE03_02750 [Chloroflexota bacterium]